MVLTSAGATYLLDEVLSYKSLFGGIKLRLAHKIAAQNDLSEWFESRLKDNEPNTIELGAAQLYMDKVYGVLSKYSLLMALLNCIYCLGFWVGLFFAALTSLIVFSLTNTFVVLPLLIPFISHLLLRK